MKGKKMVKNIEKQVGVQFALNPQQAMELIKSLASYAMSGEEFVVNMITKSESWESEGPCVQIAVNGFMTQEAKLNWSVVNSEEGQEVFYAKEGA